MKGIRDRLVESGVMHPATTTRARVKPVDVPGYAEFVEPCGVGPGHNAVRAVANDLRRPGRLHAPDFLQPKSYDLRGTRTDG